ncbi:TPA: Bax inhibitor-1 family protein [Burkholderia vietnamiensis]|nr:Bax inhibitor-1 family protein [Burkholderia vietnamiensis]
MSHLSQTVGSAPSRAHTVIRSAYLLLAISMIPTVLAAWFGMGSPVTALLNGHPILSSVGFFASALLLGSLLKATKHTPLGVLFLMAFAGLNGMFIGPMLSHMLHNQVNGAQTIAVAAGGTGVVLVVMATLGTITRRDVSGLGSWLVAGLVALVVGLTANSVLGIRALDLALGVMGCVVFAGFITYGVNRAVRGGEDSAVALAFNLYLDVVNLFLSITRLLQD